MDGLWNWKFKSTKIRSFSVVLIKLHNSTNKWIMKRGRARKLFIIPEEYYNVSYRVIGDVEWQIKWGKVSQILIKYFLMLTYRWRVWHVCVSTFRSKEWDEGKERYWRYCKINSNIFAKHNNRPAVSALPYEEICCKFEVTVDGPYGFHILYISQKSATIIASEAREGLESAWGQISSKSQRNGVSWCQWEAML